MAPSKLQLAGVLYNWALWLLIVFLVSAQFWSIFWNSMTWTNVAHYGRSPLEGLYPILGTNDEPYSDRSFVCVLQGRSYVPLTVNEALALAGSTSSAIIDPAGTAMNGYRVVKRATATIVSEALATYTTTCAELAVTMENVLDTCTRLGYNVTRDHLRIIDNLASTTSYSIEHSLPILIMPFWDNCAAARFAVPGHDGSACMFRLDGSFISSAYPTPVMKAVNRSVREAKTVEFLQRPGGRWRNGWYEDLSGMKWYADVISNQIHSTNYSDIALRRFDMRTGVEDRNCTMNPAAAACATIQTESWSATFSSTTTELAMTSLAIANGERFGLFLYEGASQVKSTSVYDWEMLLSNALTIQVLLRWMVAMIALQRGYLLRATSNLRTIGLSALANSAAFAIFPVMLLPRMKMVLVAFWSAGCHFEGQQQPFTESWFLIYPALVEVMLYYYSLLNSLGKACRLRISDHLFGLSLVLLCLLHWSRRLLAQSGWLEFDGRVSTVFYSDELRTLTLVQLFTAGIALRINGNVRSIFFAKVAILALNLVPIVVVVLKRWRMRAAVVHTTAPKTSRVEHVLAIRIANAGGLGPQLCPRSQQQQYTIVSPATATSAANPVRARLSEYELVRLGYVVYGGVAHSQRDDDAALAVLLTFDDWLLVTQMEPLRALTSLWNHRIQVIRVLRSDAGAHRAHDDNSGDCVATIASEPEMWRLDEPPLHFDGQSTHITSNDDFAVATSTIATTLELWSEYNSKEKKEKTTASGEAGACSAMGESPAKEPTGAVDPSRQDNFTPSAAIEGLDGLGAIEETEGGDDDGDDASTL